MDDFCSRCFSPYLVLRRLFQTERIEQFETAALIGMQHLKEEIKDTLLSCEHVALQKGGCISTVLLP